MKKYKLNYKNIFIFIISSISFSICLSDYITLMTKNVRFTYLGLLINTILLIISVSGFDYLKNYLEEKENNK